MRSNFALEYQIYIIFMFVRKGLRQQLLDTFLAGQLARLHQRRGIARLAI
ncbi:MAG: hypothetical protein WCY98_08300 [Castellaniella sp.]